MDSTLLILLVAFWIGLSKGGIGGPIGISIILPFLSQIMTVSQAVGLTLPLLMFGDVFAMWSYWREWDMRYLRLMLPLAVIGVVMGTYLLATLPDVTLRRILGVFILGLVVYKLASDSLKQVQYTHRDWHGYVAGWSAGFASALANVGGPPATAYLLLQKVQPTAFIGTITLFFFIINLLKVPGYLTAGILDMNHLTSVIWMFPVIPVGVWLGRKIVLWIDPRLFEWIIIVLLLWASFTLMLR